MKNFLTKIKLRTRKEYNPFAEFIFFESFHFIIIPIEFKFKLKSIECYTHDDDMFEHRSKLFVKKLVVKNKYMLFIEERNGKMDKKNVSL